MKKIFLVLAIAGLISGCAKQKFIIGAPYGTSAELKTGLSTNSVFFVSGIMQKENITLQQACGSDGSKLASVEVEETFGDGFLGSISQGIYTPKTKRVYCTK